MFFCNAFTGFGRGYGIAFARRQTDRHAATLAADFLPAAVENAGRIAGTEGIAAVETAFVTEVEQAKQRRRNVYLADRGSDSLRPDEFRAVNQEGNPVGFRGNFGGAVFFDGPVGNEDKNGIVEPWFATGLFDKSAESVIGIADGFLPAGGICGKVGKSVGNGIGIAVGGGHQQRKERLVGGCGLVGFGNGFAIQVFVGNTEQIGIGNFAFAPAAAVHDFKIAVGQKTVHAVEHAVTAVNPFVVITFGFEYAAQPVQVFAARQTEDGQTGKRGQRKVYRFNGARAVASGGISVWKIKALFGQFLQVRHISGV